MIESKIKTQIKSHLPSEKSTNPPPRPAARPNTEIRSAAIPDGEVADLEKIALGFDSNAREARNEKNKCKPFQKGLRDQWAWGERSWTRQAVTIRQAIARLTALEAGTHYLRLALKAAREAQHPCNDINAEPCAWMQNAINVKAAIEAKNAALKAEVAEARAKAIEECAKIARSHSRVPRGEIVSLYQRAAHDIYDKIRQASRSLSTSQGEQKR